MADNSLDSILAWMKVESRLLGWGLVFAFERDKANLLIAQEYIRRFGEGSYLPPIKGEVPIVENKWMEFVHDFVMSSPRLSFVSTNINDSKALLTMNVMGGSQISLKKESAGWKPDKVHEIDPLEGPMLELELHLNQVPGDVEIDGRVKLDLSESDNFRLTIGQTDHEQRMGGNFFKDLFNKLPDEKRIYALGKIQPGTNELMRPQSFELRTQASSPMVRDSQSAEAGNGGILAFIRTLSRNGGNFPGVGYKYLIPENPGKDYSATVLFDRRRVAGAVLLDEIKRGLNIKGDAFEFAFDDLGDVTSAKTHSGRVLLPRISNETSFPVGGLDIPIISSLSPLEFKTQLNPLTVSFSKDKIIVEWRPDASAILTGAIGHLPILTEATARFDLRIEYEFVGDENGGETTLQQTAYQFEGAVDYSLGGLPDEWLPLTNFLSKLITRVAMEDGVEVYIKNWFKSLVATDIPINAYLQETIKLNFGQAIQGNEIYAPNDIGYFGRINPTQTSFVVSPMEPLLKQGSTQQFTTVPLVAGVQWKVEPVEGSGTPGTINSSGMYQAPPAASISGRYTRVRVTATTPDTGYFSSALVTAVVNELTVNPLIQFCEVGGTVELSAGQLGSGPLQWKIKNPVPDESGTVLPSDKPGGDHTYHHGPAVGDKTFVLDEIEVKSATGAVRSVHVLALKMTPTLEVKIEHTDLSQGLVQLKAIFMNQPWDAEWFLPLGGPGSIDSTGLYRADLTTTDRFALIHAKVPFGPVLLEGILILPLPLVEFPKVLELLSQ